MTANDTNTQGNDYARRRSSFFGRARMSFFRYVVGVVRAFRIRKDSHSDTVYTLIKPCPEEVVFVELVSRIYVEHKGQNLKDWGRLPVVVLVSSDVVVVPKVKLVKNGTY